MSAEGPGAMLPQVEYLQHRSVQERSARGAARREDVPVAHQCTWAPDANRADPVAILERQAESRIPELIPLRHGRMALSSFAFFRGGAAIMAADLATTPTSGLRAQLCGDAHLLNFGFFETPERRLIFDLNDFDETLPGPFEWDVKRLVASIEIAGRDLSFGDGERQAATVAAARSYREAMAGFALQRNLEVWHAKLSAKAVRSRLRSHADGETGKEVKRRIGQAMRRDHLRAFERLVETSGNGLRFVSRPPIIVPVEDLLDDEQRGRYLEVVQAFLKQYRESLPPDQRHLLETYRYMHMARKVVGVGSVGTRAWIVLKSGRDDADPLVLQLKEAQQSVLAPYAGETVYESQGRRVVEGQRLMQAVSDAMLGWYRLQAWDGNWHDFYVRQLWDGKASIDVTRLSPTGLTTYGETCAWTLARAHARSGERIAIAAYLGDDASFDAAMGDFAASYADTNEADYRRFLTAIEAGRITSAAD